MRIVKHNKTLDEAHGDAHSKGVTKNPAAALLLANVAIAGTLAAMNALHSEDVISRRMAYLVSRGEDKRNTVAWRDACDERGTFNRSVSFRTYGLRRTAAVIV